VKVVLQHEIGEAAAPVSGRLERRPPAAIHVRADGRRGHGIRQRPVEKGRQRRLLAIDQLRLLDQLQAAGDFVCGPIGLVVHEFLLSSKNVDGRFVCESMTIYPQMAQIFTPIICAICVICG
jgi:hypothetical protein